MRQGVGLRVIYIKKDKVPIYFPQELESRRQRDNCSRGVGDPGRVVPTRVTIHESSLIFVFNSNKTIMK